MDILIDLLGGGGIGAAIGTVGAYFKNKQKMQHEQEMARIASAERVDERSHELNMADKQMERANVEADVAINAGELEVFSQSLKATGVQIVDTIRAVVRPVITLYMLILVTFLTYAIADAVGGLDSVPAADLVVLYKQIITNLLMLTTIVITWWFGTRPVKT